MTAEVPDQAIAEAADWLARLNRRAVSAETLRAFAAWRRDPDNAKAYARVESTWASAARLHGDTDIAAAVRAALAPPRRVLPPLAAAVAAMLVAVIGAALFWASANPAAYETERGEQRLVQLADGSRVHLNTDSRLVADLSDDERRIELVRGQALFDVAPDARRPFIVEAGFAQVRAMGTRFDVRRDAVGARVTLVEGRVRVESERGTVALEPGEQVSIADGRAAVPGRVDADAATSWTSGRITFRDTPLREAVAEMNRYSRVEIEIDRTAPVDVRVNGVFDAGDSAAFLTAVTAILPLKIERHDPMHVTLTAG